jgi:hypothetical protein
MRHIFDDEADPDRIQQCAQPATEKQKRGSSLRLRAESLSIES